MCENFAEGDQPVHRPSRHGRGRSRAPGARARSTPLSPRAAYPALRGQCSRRCSRGAELLTRGAQLLEWRPKHDNDESYNTRRAYWLETDVNKDGYMSRQELEATLPHRARRSPHHGTHRGGRLTRARVHTDAHASNDLWEQTVNTESESCYREVGSQGGGGVVHCATPQA